MKWLISILMATVLSVCALGSLPQQDFAKVEVKSTKVAGNVHMLVGAGGNIGVSAGPDGVLIVDSQFAPLADKIKAEIRKLSDSRIKFVVNTHWHGDHTGGNPIFGQESLIVAQENVRKRLSSIQKVFGNEIKPIPKEGWPVVTFEKSISVHFNGEEIKVVHFPNGHTDGDSIIFFTSSNVIHMGDHFFGGRFPFVDLENGGDVLGYTRNIEQVLAGIKSDTKIIPGHGPLSTPEDLRTFHRMLLETTGIVRERISAGKTLDEVKKEGLPDVWKEWGTGFINTGHWLETIYRSLSRNQSVGKAHSHKHGLGFYLYHGH